MEEPHILMVDRALKEEGIIRVQWITTTINTSDIYTKNCDPTTFKKHVKKVFNEQLNATGQNQK